MIGNSSDGTVGNLSIAFWCSTVISSFNSASTASSSSDDKAPLSKSVISCYQN
jgi:hypothetical protein